MPHDQLDLVGVAEPEIVFGLVGVLGTPMEEVASWLSEELCQVSYEAEAIRLSDFLAAYDDLDTPPPADEDPPDVRLNALMDRGNQLRVKLDRGDALAMHAAAHIQQQRRGNEPPILKRRAFILRQLKHPEEVLLLRRTYGDAFHLFGAYSPQEVRSRYLQQQMRLSAEKERALLERDAGEELRLGQQVTKTYHLADVFLEARGWDKAEAKSTREQIRRYIDLLFGRKILTPSLDEYGMFLASAAALRSADLSRQVGAALLTPAGEVLGLGANEVPAPRGGQYWPGPGDNRDFVRGVDSNEMIKGECLREILEHMDPDWDKLAEVEKTERLDEASSRLSSSRLMNLTEFGRAVHAEMEALLAAARVGIPVKGSTLYTTTFPCHNCAKHIVGAGIARVVYIEPYAKSLADRLHGDAIAFALEQDSAPDERVPFASFHGIAPRRFSRLFSSVEADGTRVPRKEKGGKVRTKPVGLRMAARPLTHIDREALVAQFLDTEIHAVADLGKEQEDGKAHLEER
jgi:deoxycytidylate deaminase